MDFWYFSGFGGYFREFWSILCFLAPGRSESCRHLRDLQKSIVILSNRAVWTQEVTFLMKTRPPKECRSDVWFLGFEEVGDVETLPRSPEIHRYFVKRSRLNPKCNIFEKKNIRAHMGPYGPQPGPGPNPDWAPTIYTYISYACILCIEYLYAAQRKTG